MQFDRHDRVKSVLMETVAAFIREEANTIPLITVTNLRMSPDYRNVTVLITTLPEEGESDALVFLKRKGTELRGYIKKHSSMKILPYFEFEIDYGERHRQHIDTVARKIADDEE